jgi:ATP-dependent Clp protease adaptor protein ClpS
MPSAPAPLREAPITAPAFRLRVEWQPPQKVVVHNNDRNTFDEVISVLMKAVPGCTLEMAMGYTYEIHQAGAAVVFRGDIEEAAHCARTIRSIGVLVTVEPDA